MEEIAKLPEDILRDALRDGRIHPEMETHDVGELYVRAGAELPTRFVKWRGTAHEQHGGSYYRPEAGAPGRSDPS